MTRISKWQQGVNEYATELKEFLTENNLQPTLDNMLNGASDWKEYSWGGSALIYNADIAERLATPSEIERRALKDGLSSWANSTEQWLDVQARALHQASLIVLNRGEN